MARNIDISEDLVPIGEFKTRPAKYLKQLAETGRPVVVTRHGRAAGVFLSPADYERLTGRERALAAIDRGIREADEGKLVSHAEAKERLLKKYVLQEESGDRVDTRSPVRSRKHRRPYSR